MARFTIALSLEKISRERQRRRELRRRMLTLVVLNKRFLARGCLWFDCCLNQWKVKIFKKFSVIVVVVAVSEIQDGGNWSKWHMMNETAFRVSRNILKCIRPRPILRKILWQRFLFHLNPGLAIVSTGKGFIFQSAWFNFIGYSSFRHGRQ